MDITSLWYPSSSKTSLKHWYALVPLLNSLFMNTPHFMSVSDLAISSFACFEMTRSSVSLSTILSMSFLIVSLTAVRLLVIFLWSARSISVRTTSSPYEKCTNTRVRKIVNESGELFRVVLWNETLQSEATDYWMFWRYQNTWILKTKGRCQKCVIWTFWLHSSCSKKDFS